MVKSFDHVSWVATRISLMFTHCKSLFKKLAEIPMTWSKNRLRHAMTWLTCFSSLCFCELVKSCALAAFVSGPFYARVKEWTRCHFMNKSVPYSWDKSHFQNLSLDPLSSSLWFINQSDVYILHCGSNNAIYTHHPSVITIHICGIKTYHSQTWVVKMTWWRPTWSRKFNLTEVQLIIQWVPCKVYILMKMLMNSCIIHPYMFILMWIHVFSPFTFPTLW